MKLSNLLDSNVSELFAKRREIPCDSADYTFGFTLQTFTLYFRFRGGRFKIKYMADGGECPKALVSYGTSLIGPTAYTLRLFVDRPLIEIVNHSMAAHAFMMQHIEQQEKF